MALEIGELATFLTLKDKGFTQGVDRAEQKMRGLTSTVKTGGQVIASGLATAAGVLTTLTVGLGRAGGAYNSMQQNSRAALQTLLGSQKAVNEQMEKLNALASKSPFAKSVFIQGQQQLLAFGFQAEKVIPTLDAVQNAVAATGGSATQLQDLIFVMAQIRAAGKITGQDLLQMGQRGVNAAELIGDAMGMTTAEVKEAISDNKIEAEAALDAITQGMTKKFGGATDNIKKQWSGAKDRILAAWRDTGSDIAKPFIDPNGGGQAVTWANRVADLMRQLQKHVQVGVAELEKRGAPAFKAFQKSIEAATVATAKFDLKGLIAQVDQLAKYKPLIAGTSTALTVLGLKPLPYIGALTGGIVPLVAGLGALLAASGHLDGVGDRLAAAFAPALPQLTKASVTIADLAIEVVNVLAPALVNLAEAGVRLAAGLSPVLPVAASLLGVVPPLAKALGVVVEAVTALPAPLITATAAMVAFAATAKAGTFTKFVSGIGGAVDTVKLFTAYVREAGVSAALMATNAAPIRNLGTAFSLMTGPVGLVTAGIGLATAALTFWAIEAANSEKRVNDLTESLDEQTGALTENSRAVAYKQLKDSGAIDAAKALGVSLRDVVDAALGNADAQKRVAEATEAATQKQRDAYDAAAKADEYTGNYAAALDETAKHAQTLTNEIGKTKSEIDEATAIKKDAISATRGLAKSEEEVAGAARRHADALDAVNNAQREAAAAAGDVIAAGYAFQDALEEMTSAVGEYGKATLTASGQVDTTAKANRKFIESYNDAYRSITQVIDGMAKQGKGQDEINAKRDEMIGKLREEVTQWAGNTDAANAFIETLGGIPEAKTVAVNFAANPAPALDELKATVAKVAESKGVLTIDGANDPAMAELLEALGAVNEGKGIFTIDAKDDPASARLAAMLGTVNTSTGVLTIDGKNDAARKRTDEITAWIKGQSPALKIDGQDYGAIAEAEYLKTRIGRMTAYMQIKASYNGENALGGLPFAQGGVVEYYAGGGVRRENHVAQIAPAGALRVWAEPETGGEGYIPLAPHKRARSRQIMGEIARRFGDVYLPSNRTHYAGGGINTTPTPDVGGTVVNINGVTIDARTLDAIQTVEQFIGALGYTALMERTA